MRETSLESPPVLKLLQTYFVSSWSLVADLQEAKDDQVNSYAANLATLCLEKYK